MGDEAALKLADAMNRLADAIEGKNSGIFGGGLNVWHQGISQAQPMPNQPLYQPYYVTSNQGAS